MQLRVRTIGPGLYSDEVLIAVRTTDGDAEVLLDMESVNGGRIEVGSPVGRMNGHLLVELPRETTRGEWRVWVDKSDLETPDREAAHA